MKIINDEEEMKKTLEQAKTNEWTRCPECNHLVEKVVTYTKTLCCAHYPCLHFLRVQIYIFIIPAWLQYNEMFVRHHLVS